MKATARTLLLLAILPLAQAAASPSGTPQAVIHLPGGAHGIGLDDIGYAAALNRITIPAGATGNLILIAPATRAMTAIHGVSATSASSRQHREGTSSAVYADGYLFASDHDPAEIVTIDPRTRKVLARTPLEGQPDYVRHVARTHEIWVTEPGKHQIQIFKLSATSTPRLTPETTISIPGGPESLVIDNRRNRAYTNQWKSKTVAMSLDTHKVLATWPNTCKASRGLALDAAHNHLFVACKEGKVVTLAPARRGKVLASASAGAGIDIISYSPRLHHLYVPGARAATLTIFDASASGTLEPVALYQTAKGAHCVTGDNDGHVFVCDPHAGTVLEINDHRGGKKR